MKVTIYWDTKHLDPKDIPRIKKKIRDRFNIPDYTTVNGETPCNIKDEDMELLRECASVDFFRSEINSSKKYNMKTISIDVDATSVQIETSMAGNGYVRVTAEVDERDSTKLLDSISKDDISDYMRENGYICKIE